MTSSYRSTLIVLLLAGSLMGAQPALPEQQPARPELPGAVLRNLQTRFPGAEIRKWTREKKGAVVLYDVEFTQDGRNLEADINEDGSLHNWEKALRVSDLPPVVRTAALTRYPGADLHEVMAVTAVADGRETLEGYEILLTTKDGKEEEISVAPDGKILEDTGVQQNEGGAK